MLLYIICGALIFFYNINLSDQRFTNKLIWSTQTFNRINLITYLQQNYINKRKNIIYSLHDDKQFLKKSIEHDKSNFK